MTFNKIKKFNFKPEDLAVDYFELKSDVLSEYTFSYIIQS